MAYLKGVSTAEGVAPASFSSSLSDSWTTCGSASAERSVSLETERLGGAPFLLGNDLEGRDACWGGSRWS